MKEISENKEIEDVLDFKSVVMIFWERKFLIISIVLISFVSSVFITLQMPNQYKASITLAPTEKSLSGVANQMGLIGLAAGLNFEGPSVRSSEVAVRVMQSWGFIDKFIRENNLEVELMAAEGWDPETNQLTINQDIYDSENSRWLEESPTSWELFEEFSDRFGVVDMRGSSMISLSFEFYSPNIAKEWLDLIVRSTNDDMRQRKIEEVSRNIKYIEDQVQKTSVAEMKTVFLNIIAEQTKTMMLAAANIDYAFFTVNEAMVPEMKSKPFRTLLVIEGTLIGGMIAILLTVILRIYTNTSKN